MLSGFEQVEDEIATLRILEQQAAVEEAAVKAAREAEALTLNQYKAGTVPYSSVITAQTTRLAAEETALTVLSSRLQASVALIEALGGGWERTSCRGKRSAPAASRYNARIVQRDERRGHVPAQHGIARLPFLFGRQLFQKLHLPRRISRDRQAIEIQQPIARERGQPRPGCENSRAD